MAQSNQHGAFRCPTRADILGAIFALLPRGRAWQTHEGGPVAGYGVGFDPGGFNPDGFSTTYQKPSVIRQFWSAVADVFSYLTDRLCALRLEFWCASQSETTDLWMLEYGLPDACDPFPDLCTKVAAIGGTRCEYYAAVAARSGWVIECISIVNDCGTRVGSRTSMAGRAITGPLRNSATILIRVYLGDSVAYVGGGRRPPLAGRLKAGRRLSCLPDISPLQCTLERIVHAEILINYEVFNG